MNHRTAAYSNWEQEVRNRNTTAMKIVIAGAEAQEGSMAFAEKRPPVRQGR